MKKIIMFFILSISLFATTPPDDICNDGRIYTAIFTNTNPQKLANQINAFIIDKDIIDIQFSTAPSQYGEKRINYSTLIIYRR